MVNIDEKKAGVVLSYISQAVLVLSGIIYTPIMLRLLGQSEYGLYQMVNATVSYLGLLSFGFSSSYMRFYSRFRINNSEREIAQLNGMFMTIFMVISGVCLICGFFMVTNVEAIFGDGLTNAEITKARILFILMIISMAITFPKSVFSCIILSQEKFLFLKALEVFQSIANPFITLPLLILGYGSVAMVSVAFGLNLLTAILYIYFSFVKLKAKFLFKGFKFSLLKEMWVFTFFIFLNQIIDQINWSIDKIMLGRFINTTAVAVYGVGSALNSMYIQFANAVSGVFVPKVNLLVSQKNKMPEINILFIKIGRIQFSILALAMTGLVLFGRPFVYFWSGAEYSESYYVALLLIVPITFPLLQNVGIEIQRAMNLHKTRSVVYFCIAILNLLITIPLIKNFGAIGAAMGTAVAMVLGNIVFMNWYYHTHIGLNVIAFWKSIASMCPAVGIAAIFGVMYTHFVDIFNFIYMVLGMGLYVLMYACSMYFCGFNENEKELIRKPIHKLLKKN